MIMAFVSRHAPTARQMELAREAGFELIAVGDVDAAADDLRAAILSAAGGADAVACVHPLIALDALQLGYLVGVYLNANRAPEGQPPVFEASRLVIQSGGHPCDLRLLRARAAGGAQ